MAAKNRRNKTRRTLPHNNARTAKAQALLLEASQAHHDGDLDVAERGYRKYLRAVPDSAKVWHSVAGLQLQRSDSTAAINALEKACSFDIENVDYLCDLGGAFISVRKFVEAEQALKSALAIMPTSVGAQYNLSNALYSQGRLAEANAGLNKLIKQQPEFAEAHHNLGVTLRAEGKIQLAVVSLEKARVLQPENISVLLELGRCYRELGSLERATHFYAIYVGCNSDTDAVIEFAEILDENGESERAESLLIEQVAHAPEDDRLHTRVAQIRHNAGDLGAAEDALRNGLRANPRSIPAIIGLSQVRRIAEVDDPLFVSLRDAISRVGADDEHGCALHFAIAKIHDDVGNYDKAFEHYRIANAKKGDVAEYDSANVRDYYSRLINYFTGETINRLACFGSQSELPLLIIGMPRSGTSLVEQVLSSHPQAVGAGELRYFPSLIHQISDILETDTGYPECLAEAKAHQFAKFEESYVSLLRRHSADASRITDKLPGNYMNVGLFKALFPNGKIISCRRDPLDVALSIYFQYFSDGHDYAWRLDDIAKHYAQYDRLMAHWLRLFPDSIFEFQYNEAVGAFESTVRDLVTFCNLPWDEACLTFYATKRNVKTASNWQIRQPIYNRSLARWRHYESHIQPLIDALAVYRS